MGKIIILMTAIIMFLILSCSKPIEKMDIKLIYTIDGSFEPETVAEYDKKFTIVSDIEVDKEGNVYLFNPRLERILKFTPEGNFIKYFGSRGVGKGEFMNAMDFAILNDTIYIKNTFTNIIIRNTLDGEYIDYFEDKTGRFGLGEALRAVSNDRMIGYIGMSEKKDDKVLLTNKLSIMDNKLNEIKVLREYSTEFDRNDPKYFELITKYTAGGGEIYVAENNDDKYMISIYNLEGKKSGEIKKEYIKIKYNSEEVEKIKTMPISIRKTKNEMDTLETKLMYKKSINDIFYDKYGRLLVCPSVKRTEKNKNDFIADVFENEKYVKTAVIPQLKGEDFLNRFDSQVYFIGGRIYEVLHKEMKVNVYEY